MRGLKSVGAIVQAMKPQTESVVTERTEQVPVIEEWTRAGWSLVDAQQFGGDVRLVFKRQGFRRERRVRQ
jgi:hypothetical protein